MEDNKKFLLIMTIIELVITKGIPATLNIIKAWNVEDPTYEDIKALKLKVKDPETYFVKKESDIAKQV